MNRTHSDFWQCVTGAGLKNVGNSCYLNSVLQCVIYTPAMLTYLLTCDHAKSCKYFDGLMTATHATQALNSHSAHCAKLNSTPRYVDTWLIARWHASDTLTLQTVLDPQYAWITPIEFLKNLRREYIPYNHYILWINVCRTDLGDFFLYNQEDAHEFASSILNRTHRVLYQQYKDNFIKQNPGVSFAIDK